MNSETKNCKKCHADFIIEPRDFAFYEKIQAPLPTRCPECRLVRRLSWRNERSLYRRNCDLCKKPMISVFHPDTKLTVYCSPCWWSDAWDGMEYGVDFDPAQSFMQQMRDLLGRVPVPNLYGLYTTLVNSDYSNMVGFLKDCYMVTYADHNENCLNSSMILWSKDSADCLLLYESELCYESINCTKCYRALYSLDCDNCTNIQYSRNLSGCSDCYGCVNLKNKKYHIFNEPYSKEEYGKKLKEVQDENPYVLWNLFPQKYMHGVQNSDVSGDYIHNSKNVHDSYLVYKMEDSRYCTYTTGGKDCYDFTNYAETSELLYESLQSGDHAARIRWSFFVISNVQNVDYSMFIIGGQNIFGSVGLKKKDYCILNKQYSKEEYEKLRSQIIEGMRERGEYGEFFPSELSPFAYNETAVQEHFPLTKEKAIQKGYRWRDPEIRSYVIGDGIYACEHGGACTHACSTAFRPIPAELEFYAKIGVPIPKICPGCRHGKRLEFRNPAQFFERTCACAGANSLDGVYENTRAHSHGAGKCSTSFKTSYASGRPEIIYCEECYLAEIA